MNDSGHILLKAVRNGAESYHLLLPVEIYGYKRQTPQSSETSADLKELKIANLDTAINVINYDGNIFSFVPDSDIDRFHLRVPGAKNFGAVKLKVGTVNNPDHHRDKPVNPPVGWVSEYEYDDPVTEIPLELNGVDLVSKSQLLVSDDVDDEYTDANMPADEAPGDRSHRVQLNGNFIVDSYQIGSKPYKDLKWKIPVKVRRTVFVDWVKCKDGGVFCWTDLNITAAEKILRERYAQVGIDFVFTIRAGQDISNDGKIKFGDYPLQANGQGKLDLSGRLKKIVDDAYDRGTPRTWGNDTNRIMVFLVNELSGSGTMTAYGCALPMSKMKAGEQKFGNKIFLAPGSVIAPSHEILHILLNAAHDDFAAEFGQDDMIWHTEEGRPPTKVRTAMELNTVFHWRRRIGGVPYGSNTISQEDSIYSRTTLPR